MKTRYQKPAFVILPVSIETLLVNPASIEVTDEKAQQGQHGLAKQQPTSDDRGEELDWCESDWPSYNVWDD